MMCPNCGTREAIKDETLGWIPCKACQIKKIKLGEVPEFTSEAIKDQRKAFWSDIHPAHRSGVPSKEFRDRWGAEAMKRQGFTDEEIKNCRYVYSDDKYYSDGDK